MRRGRSPESDLRRDRASNREPGAMRCRDGGRSSDAADLDQSAVTGGNARAEHLRDGNRPLPSAATRATSSDSSERWRCRRPPAGRQTTCGNDVRACRRLHGLRETGAALESPEGADDIEHAEQPARLVSGDPVSDRGTRSSPSTRRGSRRSAPRRCRPWPSAIPPSNHRSPRRLPEADWLRGRRRGNWDGASGTPPWGR